MPDAPDLAALIAAVRRAMESRAIYDEETARLRAAQAVLEGLADREWLNSVLCSTTETRDRRRFTSDRCPADALLAALLARTGGGNG